MAKKRNARVRISNVDTLATLIDRLIIETNKCSILESLKFEEHKKTNPDLNKIAEWDKLSRTACNLRALIKNRIDEVFEQIVKGLGYSYNPEIKIFSGQRASEVIEERAIDIGNNLLHQKLSNTIYDILHSRVYEKLNSTIQHFSDGLPKDHQEFPWANDALPKGHPNKF